MHIPAVVAVLCVCAVWASGHKSKPKMIEVETQRKELEQSMHPQVRVDAGSLTEIEALRKEISLAVGRQREHAVPSWMHNRVEALDSSQSTRGDESSAAAADVNSPLASILEPDIERNVTFSGKFNLNSKSFRDVVHLVEVAENLHFNYDGPVIFWSALPHCLQGNQHLLVGLTRTSLVLARLDGGAVAEELTVQVLDSLEFADGLITEHVATYLHWNNVEGYAEGYIIVAQYNEFHWIGMGEKCDRLTVDWSLKMYRNITTFKYLRHDDESFLMVSAGPANAASLDIFRFNLERREFSSAQRIPMPAPCHSIAIVVWQHRALLGLPGLNETYIYEYVHKQFELFKVIPSPAVTAVTGFQAGGLCFFAIGGSEPKIFRYKSGDLHEIEIHGKTFQFVRDWTPITIRTYREDIIVLVQYEVLFDTHTLPVIGTLRWNGESFETIYDVPCLMDDKYHAAGINCLIDLDKSMGLSGAVLLTYSHNHHNNVSIIVPRNDTKSGLYSLKIEIRPALHPNNDRLMEIQMLLDYFSNLKDYNDEVFVEANDTIANAFRPHSRNVVTAKWTVDRIYANEGTIADNELPGQVSESEFSALITSLQPIVRDVLDSEETIATVVPNGESEMPFKDQVLDNGRFTANSVLQQNSAERLESSRIDRLRLRELVTEAINGVSVKELIFITSDDIHLMNKLQVESLSVTEEFDGHVNGISIQPVNNFSELSLEQFLVDDMNVGIINGLSFEDLSNRLVGESKTYDTIRVSNLCIGQNLNADVINEAPWIWLQEQIVNTSDPFALDEVYVEQNVIIESASFVDTLNGLKFPDDFLWVPFRSIPEITGRKTFKGTTVTETVDTNGFIEGVYIGRTIPLFGDVEILGETTLQSIEVETSLDLLPNITIEGSHLEDFLPNPTLTQANLVNVHCVFESLTVNGTITVAGTFGELELNQILDDIMYRNEVPLEIESFKEFNEVVVDRIETELLNGIEISRFATLTEDEDLGIAVIMQGSIEVDRMHLEGLFDSVNVTDLNLNSIKNIGDQVTEAELVNPPTPESGPNANTDLWTRMLTVESSVNNIAVADYLLQDRLCAWPGLIVTERADIKELHLMAAVGSGSGIINDQSLDDFNNLRLSKTSEQIITAPVTVRHLNTPNITFWQLKSILIRDSQRRLGRFGPIPQAFELHVQRNINLKELNERDFHILAHQVVWLNESNIFTGNVHCLDVISIENDILLQGYINGQDDLLGRVIWRSEARPVQIPDFKTFRNSVKIERNLQVKAINAILLENLATKTNPVFCGSLTIAGNLKIHETLIAKDLFLYPGYTLEHFSNLYAYDPNRNVFRINAAQVTFIDPVSVDVLQIGDALNGIQEIEWYLHNIVVHFENETHLVASKSLTKKCIFTHVNVDHFDGDSLENYFRHAVFKEDDHEIHEVLGKVEIRNAVEITRAMATDQLTVDSINRVKFVDWFADLVLLNRSFDFTDPIQIPEEMLHMSRMEVVAINGIPFESFNLAHTNQTLNGSYHIRDVATHSIEVYGRVNGYRLIEEQQNTLMVSFSRTILLGSQQFASYDACGGSSLQTTGDQILATATVYASVRVMRSLTAKGLVNNRNISCTIRKNDTNSIINSPLWMQHLQTESLHTDHLISGKDFAGWHRMLMKYAEAYIEQIVPASWTIRRANITQKLLGSTRINNLDSTDLNGTLNANRVKIQDKRVALRNAYKQMCYEIRDLIDNRLGSSCSFQYLTFQSSIIEPEGAAIDSIYVFNHLEDFFVLYSVDCWSRLLKWAPLTMTLAEVTTIPSGSVRWTHTVDAEQTVYLISHQIGQKTCPGDPELAIWIFNGRTVAIARLFEMEITDFQMGSQVGYFYAIEKNIVREFFAPTALVTKEWRLNEHLLRFVPNAVNLGLAFYSEQNVYVIASKKRMSHTGTDIVMGGQSFESDTIGDASKQWTEQITLVDGSRIFQFKNRILPLQNSEELIILTPYLDTGYRKMRKFIVTTKRMEDQDAILIYNDIFGVQPVQIIPCSSPTSLTGFNLRSQMFLMFLEKSSRIKIYMYRGISGFEEYMVVNLNKPAQLLAATTLPRLQTAAHPFLILVMDNEVQLLRANTIRQCSNESVHCEVKPDVEVGDP